MFFTLGAIRAYADSTCVPRDGRCTRSRRLYVHWTERRRNGATNGHAGPCNGHAGRDQRRVRPTGRTRIGRASVGDRDRRAVFVEDTDGLGPCTRDVYFGPYKPTPTPIGTPTAGCNRSRAESIDLTSVDERTHEAAAPETAAAHAFVATAVVGTDEGGNEITEIFGTGGAVPVKAETTPSGPYGVEVGVEAADDASDYDYAVTTERFDPDA